MALQQRVPAGVPAGGRFSATARDEAQDLQSLPAGNGAGTALMERMTTTAEAPAVEWVPVLGVPGATRAGAHGHIITVAPRGRHFEWSFRTARGGAFKGHALDEQTAREDALGYSEGIAEAAERSVAEPPASARIAPDPVLVQMLGGDDPDSIAPPF